MVSSSHRLRCPLESPAESPLGVYCRPRPSTSGMSGENQNPLQSPPIERGSSVGAVGNLKYVEEFEILETLGKGFFGVVYKVREKRTESQQQKNRSQPAVLVMKEPIIQNSQSGFSAKKIVSREYYMLRLLKHPNILKTRGICLKQINAEWKLNLLVDYCDCGSLQQTILNLQKAFTWLHRCTFSLDICRAMAFVHAQGYMHRDLTSMNILLQSNGRNRCPKAVVADFGLSCRIPNEGEIKQQVGTQNWMSPEMLAERFYNEKSDVFSFGIIMCQMIARIDADHDVGLYRTQVFGLDYIRYSCHCPSDTPLNLLRTAFSCCLWNAGARPTFEQLLDQINQIVSEDLSNPAMNDDARMGRSHSDAAIRSTKTSSLGYLNGKRCSQTDAFRPEIVIPEGIPLDNPSTVGTPTTSELSNRMKDLAISIAAEDPDYEESSLNPFSNHDRYRSIRKMKPGDRYFVQREAVRRETMKAENSSRSSRIEDTMKSRRKRSASVPSLCFSFGTTENRLPLSKTSKRSFTLGLGKQRDLQGRITYSFREFDKKFTNTNRSGILTSHNDLSRLSNDSLDEVFPNENDEEEEENSSSGEENDDSEEDLDVLRVSDYPSPSPPNANGISKPSSVEENEAEKNVPVERKGRSSVKRFIRRSSLVNDSQCSLS